MQRVLELRADRRAPEAEFLDRAVELVARGGGILHRQRGEPAQPARVCAHKLGHRVVVAPAEGQGLGEVDVVEIGQRAGRQDLEVDMRLVHLPEAQLGVGERAAGVLHADELVVAHAVPGLACLVGAELGAVPPRRAIGRLQPHMRVQVDELRLADPGHVPVPPLSSRVSARCAAGVPRRSRPRACSSGARTCRDRSPP